MIGGDEQVETSFRLTKKIAVAEIGPAHFVGGRHFMPGQSMA